MVTHYSGNDLSILAQKLSDCLQENMPADPLAPQVIIVPNRDTAKWLQLRLSEYSGIAANLNFMLPG
jgi:exodeoxyribonuclease V gamma subunit